jgi:hypothetical protein
MASDLNALTIYKILGKKDWKPPTPWGEGFLFSSRTKGQIIVTPMHLEEDWIHASISRVNEMPTYDDLKLMHLAVFGDGFSYQVFAPTELHVNLHAYALHLWGRADGKPAMPDFAGVFEKEFGYRTI